LGQLTSSVHLHHDKAVFKVEGLPVEAFAASLGLAGAPKIGLLSRAQAKERKNAPHAPAAQSEDEEDLHSSGSADDSEEHGRDVELEDVGTSQDEHPPAKEQGKVTKVRSFYLSYRIPNLQYLD
jgi:ATP-dependent RNA helicase DDX10/DBP4